MKNIKFSPLVIVSISLLIVSLGVLGKWAYKNFSKNDDPFNGDLIILQPIDSLITLSPIADSIESTKAALANKYKKASLSPKASPDNHSLHPMNLEPSHVTAAKLPSHESAKEIKRLKAEIETLLKNKTSDADLKLARQKNEELEQKVDNLVDKNSDVERENKRLFAVLRKLSDNRTGTEQNAKPWPAVFENKNPVTKAKDIKAQVKAVPVNKSIKNLPPPASKKNDIITPVSAAATTGNSFAVEGMVLTALTVTDNKEIETSIAYNTDKLTAAVTVKNLYFQNNTAEIIVVVLQPDGRVLQKSTWESGTFQSPEGKKIYSCKMRFNYTKGETKHLLFSLNSANSMKGNYVLQVYSGGVLIGKIVKPLS